MTTAEGDGSGRDWRAAEVHHRVANSFQMVAALLAGERRRSPEAALALDRAHAQLMSLSALHRTLMGATENESIDVGPYLRAICADLTTGCLAPRGIQLRLRVTPDDFDDRSCALIGMVAVELVFNAAKHAFAGGGGQIEMVFDNTPERVPRLSVSDNGIGLAWPADTTTAGTILSHIARSGDVDLAVDQLTPGTRVRVTFPDMGIPKCGA